MLTDPITITNIDIGGGLETALLGIGNISGYTTSGQELRLTDIGPGSSVREGLDHDDSTRPMAMTIQRSNSKENAPFPTKRVVIRLDTKYQEGETSVTASAYLVVVIPTSPNTTNRAFNLARNLCFWGLFGSKASTLGDNASELARVLAGEP